jgi:hypothetical protein
MFMFKYTVDGITCQLRVTQHAIERMAQRRVDPASALKALVKETDSLLNLKSGDKFCLYLRRLNVSLVGELYYAHGTVVVKVITAFNSVDRFVPREGTIAVYA